MTRVPSALPRSTASAEAATKRNMNTVSAARIGTPKMSWWAQCNIGRMSKVFTALLPFLLSIPALAQTAEPATAKALAAHVSGNDRDFEVTQKKIDDLLWYFKVGDVAAIDKVELAGKSRRDKNSTGQGAGNPLIVP